LFNEKVVNWFFKNWLKLIPETNGKDFSSSSSL
jgi:hypothetical protein